MTSIWRAAGHGPAYALERSAVYALRKGRISIIEYFWHEAEGDSLIVLGGSRLHGRGSGIELETEVAQLLRIERGLVARERDFFSWDDALRAAALDPGALDLPR